MNRKLILAALFAAALSTASAESTKAPGIRLVRVPNGGIQPQAVLDREGTLHLLYFSGDPKAGDLFYVTSRDSGASWSMPLRVNSIPGSAIALGTIRGGQIAIGKNGRAHVAWNGSAALESKGPLNPEDGRPGAPMLYSRLNSGHTAFEGERSLMTRTFGLDGGGTIAADSAGNVYVAWHGKAPGAAEGEAGRQVWIAVSHDEGAAFAAEKPAWGQPTGACGCCGMAMFSDSRNALRVLYRSATADIHRDIYLLTSFDHARTFSGRTLHTWDINACPMSSMAFSEGAGMVAATWETAGQVYFENVARPDAVPAGAPGPGKGRKHPRIAIAPNGDTLLVWTEGTGWQRGGSLAWQLFEPAGRALGDVHTQPGLPVWSFAALIATPAGFLILY